MEGEDVANGFLACGHNDTQRGAIFLTKNVMISVSIEKKYDAKEEEKELASLLEMEYPSRPTSFLQTISVN